MTGTVSAPTIQAFANGSHGDPFAILGPHEVTSDGRRLAIRAFLPYAERVTVRPVNSNVPAQPMQQLDERGFFEAVYPNQTEGFLYELEIVDRGGLRFSQYDPYQFGSRLSDYDLYLIGEGRHNRLYEKLGAHINEVGAVKGVSFSVWAPNASRVSVVGDFNGWDGRIHVMRKHPGNGVWEIFIPVARVGQRYKFEIRSASGHLMALKSDPVGFEFEPDEPRTACVVADLTYEWHDGEWMANRWRHNALDAPIAIYEVHLGSWMRSPDDGNRWLSYTELAERLGAYVKDLGYTHVELLPVTEHPFYASWGYQPIGMFAPTRRYGTPTQFMEFVDRLHQLGIGVILDWVPAHFPRDPNGLVYFDGTHLYEHADPRQAEHRDWGTLIYNYGRNEVSNYLIASALFWLDKYHLDGLRVDAVASMLYLDYSRQPGEWVANEYGGNENLAAISFVKRMNEATHGEYPGTTTIAEESTAFPAVSRPTYVGGLGFGYKWNMGWMHDVLEYMTKDPVHRKYHHNLLTFALWYAWTENFILPLSHDEVVHMKGSLHQKMPGDDWQKFANLRAFYGFMYGHPGKKLLFMGGEFGQTTEWNHDASLDWHLLVYGPYHAGLQRVVRDLNRIYRECPALYELDFDPSGFQWIDHSNWSESVIAFYRRGRDPKSHLVFVSNFTPVVREDYRLGVPSAGYYQELLNSDAEVYGGSNVGNSGGVSAEPMPAHGHPQSLHLTLPPLATLIFQPGREA